MDSSDAVPPRLFNFEGAHAAGVLAIRMLSGSRTFTAAIRRANPDRFSVRSPEWRSGAQRAPLQKIKERRPWPGGRRGGTSWRCGRILCWQPCRLQFCRVCRRHTCLHRSGSDIFSACMRSQDVNRTLQNETPISRMCSSLVFRHFLRHSSFVLRHSSPV
jgi:hypothetical protein